MILPLEKYNQLVEKIVEAVPEIMELKLGCRIECRNNILANQYGLNGEGYVVTSHSAAFNDKLCYMATREKGHREVDLPFIYHNPKWFKIIGRPIQLADVLRAINSLGDTKKTYAISQEGKFFSVRYIPALLDYEVEYYSKWDLSLPLDQQNDEVKEFLYNLLVK
jgi:hypothetical protein